MCECVSKRCNYVMRALVNLKREREREMIETERKDDQPMFKNRSKLNNFFYDIFWTVLFVMLLSCVVLFS